MTVANDIKYNEILSQYNIVPEMIQKVTPNVWKATSSNGVFALKNTNCDEKKLEIIFDILSSIEKECDILTPLQNDDGYYVTDYEDGKWYMTEWKHPSTYSFSATKIAEIMAKIHIKTKSLITFYSDKFKKTTLQDLMNWKRLEVRLSEIEETNLTNKDYKSPLENQLQGDIKDLQNSLLFAIRAMEKFIEIEDGIAPRYVLCHTRLHKSNIIDCSGKAFLIDFDNADFDTPVRDLTTLLRRPSFRLDNESPARILQAYEKINPLNSKERKILAYNLSYPQRITKIINNYYSNDPQIKNKINEGNILAKYKNESEHFKLVKNLVPILWPSKKSS